VDSSTNAALFAEGESIVKTFTMDYDAEYASYPSELKFARMMAASIRAENYEKVLGVDEFVSFIPEMVHFQDEPIGDPVCVPIYFLSQLARKHGVTVCQLGEGADELFIGYPGWQQSLKLHALNELPVPRFAKQAAYSGLSFLGKGYTHRAEQLRRGIDSLPIFWGGAEGFNHVHKAALLSPRLRKAFANYSSWEVLSPIWERFQQKAWDPSLLNWMSYLDLNFRLPELLLMRVDKMSMAVGLEARVPFLDHELAALAMSIPATLKLKNGTLKYVLKKAIRGLVPAELVNRKKQGFGLPVYEWFNLKLRSYAHDRLRRFCKDTDYLDWSQVSLLFDQNQAQQIWYLLNLAMVVANVCDFAVA
jgi:asparagine synthase (glutamine-hydrolysing)